MLTEKDRKFVETLKRVVAENPEFVYTPSRTDSHGRWWTIDGEPFCSYFPDDRNPNGCLIGFVLREVGAELDPAKHEGLSAYCLLNTLGYSPRVCVLADDMQSRQDEGDSWGHALALAAEFHDLLRER